MTMLQSLRRLIWRATGANAVLARLDDLSRQTSFNASSRQTGTDDGSRPAGDAGTGLEILPGTPYSRYALPIEYMPSRAYAPRYGATHPVIPELADWFRAHNGAYQSFLDETKTLRLDHIAHNAADTGAGKPAWTGGAITAFDCLMLYAMVKKHKPRTYCEIGSGMTTCFARQAIDDFKIGTKILSVDPQPRQEIDRICDEVIRDGLETCDMTLFERLEPGDFLFMDGSHRTFMNSDVTVFFIDVLPRLKPGVIVHVHDILLPWDYADSFKQWYWNEQYMLAVYLMNAKDRLSPVLPTAWIARSPEFAPFFQKAPIDLGSPDANESWKHGGSMWFTKTA